MSWSFGGTRWTSIEPDDDNGLLFFEGAEHRVPVESGFFVLVEWNVADGDWEDRPELVGFA